MINEELLSLFPTVFKEHLKNKMRDDKNFDFPDGTEFDYTPIKAYRGVRRIQDDCSPVTEKDFKSKMEIGRKNPRGCRVDENDLRCHGVSLFVDIKVLKIAMKLPRTNQQIAEGFVYCKGGPRLYTLHNEHICWWLFQNVSVENFKIIKEKNHE